MGSRPGGRNRRVHLVFPDLAVPGATETVGAFAEQAVAAGVRRIVLLSGRGEEEAERAERAVMASGADWTIVRCAWFHQNFSEGHFLEPLLDGEPRCRSTACASRSSTSTTSRTSRSRR